MAGSDLRRPIRAQVWHMTEEWLKNKPTARVTFVTLAVSIFKITEF